MKTEFHDLFIAMLDDRIEMYGVRNTICWLLDHDLSKEQLLELEFAEDEIDYVIAHPDEDYDMC